MFLKKFSNLSYYTGTFLVGTHWFGVPFPKLQTFSGIFWLLPIDYSPYEKTIIGIFDYLLILKVITTSQGSTRLICERAIFAQNASIILLALIFLIRKNPVEKLCKVLEMELKTYTPVGPKFIFEKIKFKVLHYLQHDLIRQRIGLSKDQISMFKSLVIN